MFDFASGLPLLLKFLVYPTTVLGVLYLMYYIGHFFCVGVCEKITSAIEKEGHETDCILNSFMVLTILFTIAFWLSWIYQIEFLVFLLTVIGFVIWLFNLIATVMFLFHPEGILIPFFVNTHRKIYERKHGKRK